MSIQAERPRLLVHVPAGYEAERRYAAAIILGERYGLDHQVVVEDRTDVTITLAGDSSGRFVAMPDILFQTSDTDWLKARSIPQSPLPTFLVPTGWTEAKATSMPVIFGAPGAVAAAARADHGATVAVDVFGTCFFLLTRYEEIARPAGDEHDRFASSDSCFTVDGLVSRPLVDECVGLLWDALRVTWPMLDRPPRDFSLWLTHDVDQPFGVFRQPTKRVARSLVADVLLRRDPGLATTRTRAWLESRRSVPAHDPFDTFDFLMDVSEQHNARSAFFFLAGNEPSDFDFRYRTSDPEIVDILRRVRARGHDVGLHASYLSYGDLERTRRELAALQHVCAAIGPHQDAWGVRQHFLRFQAPRTWSIQAESGLAFDSTVGFHDRPGFRAGTASRFTVFDARSRTHLDLVERPLIVMDVTFSEYLRVSPPEAMQLALDVIHHARRHRGEAVLLFHNNSLARKEQRSQYRELIAAAARD